MISKMKKRTIKYKPVTKTKMKMEMKSKPAPKRNQSKSFRRFKP